MFIFRMEKVDIKKVRCQAKVLGTIVSVAGAMLMTLYKGHVVNLLWSTNSSVPETNSDKDWVKGSILLIFATLFWASFFILQVHILYITTFSGNVFVFLYYIIIWLLKVV